ncbi:type II and III secretion system protein family protein [Pectobacterium parmentieri]|uniref:Type II and III secretion system protein family protein n=1 Tax=Pectobacterium parmentieri TaxID=1905730 RepID=A0A0H3HZN3_PECPM|nr:type II and III secretion system protein family protein [Pectobacterium parmentieri]ACX86713.1 type II and III secretion system protein [Pectobacterium parmentieri WPP163]AFI88904.1 Type II/IV secretion system secretin RcpA/CpaC associated with Flp pilus assembly [Pectobacterium parmentieri]AOR60088.1 type II and III secretion system protein [Pectobacterium parmentieri]AYH00200.1 type II and III secretion system protein family protein [Pectobacterium parmentieri]AYH04655.1 type II and III s
MTMFSLFLKSDARGTCKRLLIASLFNAVLPVMLMSPAATQAAGVSVAPVTDEVHLTVHQGRLLHLDALPDSVLVADPNIASFELPSPGNLFVYAKNVGTTTLYAMDENGKVINAIRLVSEHDLKALSERIKREFPGADIQLEASIPSGVIVRGSVDTPQDAKRVIDSIQTYINASSNGAQGGGGGGDQLPGSSETSGKVVNQLKIKTPSQINIQVRVVEVSRKLTSELGFNWAASLSTGSGNMTAGSGSRLNLFNATTGRFANPTDSGFLNFGRSRLGGLLTAMNQQGMATVLAEPNLTAMSGETAAFAAGGEVPIVLITNNSVSIDYKSYGVILRMTPTLLSANRISLHIAPEVSELTDVGSVQLEGGSRIPALTVRRADTTVELASGQSFALAGMLRSAGSQTINGVPGLSGIPMFGRLFESESTNHEETELVIIATAYVVEPVNAGDLQTPGQGIRMLDSSMPRSASIGYLY